MKTLHQRVNALNLLAAMATSAETTLLEQAQSATPKALGDIANTVEEAIDSTMWFEDDGEPGVKSCNDYLAAALTRAQEKTSPSITFDYSESKTVEGGQHYQTTFMLFMNDTDALEVTLPVFIGDDNEATLSTRTPMESSSPDGIPNEDDQALLVELARLVIVYDHFLPEPVSEKTLASANTVLQRLAPLLDMAEDLHTAMSRSQPEAR